MTVKVSPESQAVRKPLTEVLEEEFQRQQQNR
jgi:hypothetical protein